MLEASLLVLVIKMLQLSVLRLVVPRIKAPVKACLRVGLAVKSILPQLHINKHLSNVVLGVLSLANVPSIGVLGVNRRIVIEVVARTVAFLQSRLQKPVIQVVDQCLRMKRLHLMDVLSGKGCAFY